MSYKNKKHNVKESIEEYTKVKNKTTSPTRKKNSKNNSSKEISKTSFNTIEVIIIMVITILFGILIGYFICYIRNDSKQDFSKDEINEFIELYDDVLDEYYKDIDSEDLIEYAIKGMIDNLDDQYSEYINKKDVDLYEEKLKGSFVGIGVEIMYVENGSPIITKVYDDSPAKESGIINGDILYKVENKELLGLSMEEISNLIKKGKNGETIKITILRNNESLEIKVKREKIKVNPVESKVLENNIGYIAFTSFDETTAEDFKSKFEELQKQNIKSLIIDLRNNGGGLVDQAVDIAGYVLDKDSVVLYEVDKNENEVVEKTTTDPIIDMPIIILTNENTASASEILAGALKDFGKAKTVGIKTYGKGVIQEILSVKDGSGIKITTSEYQTPNRNKINKIGIEPDEKVELPDDVTSVLNVPEDKDTQLQKAIEMLK